MFSRWISESGVPRGHNTSFRSSFSAPLAARWIRFNIAPRAICPALDASRNDASFCRFSFPRSLNDGIGEPGLTQLGHSRCETWNWTPFFFAPSAERSGAPRFEEPVPRYVWQLVQPDSAKRFA